MTTDLAKQPRKRPGASTLFLLSSLGLFVAFLALVVEGARLWSARQELQIAADAAALAAVQALADDGLLTLPPVPDTELLSAAQASAARAAHANPIQGQPCELPLQADAARPAAVQFGYLDATAGSPWHATMPGLVVEGCVNAVRVRTERSRASGGPIPVLLGRFVLGQGVDLTAEAAALLERDVVGFAPSSTTPAPVMPLALFSDPAHRHPASWEAQTAAGQDRFRFNRETRKFEPQPPTLPRGQGLFEMTVRLPLSGADFTAVDREEEPNATLLLLPDAGYWPRQVIQGLAPTDLGTLGGRLLLPLSGHLPVPGLLFAPEPTSEWTKGLLEALQVLAQKAEPRVFPLYEQLDGVATSRGAATVALSGFVAARMVQVQRLQEPYPHLEIILEPCQVVTASAVIDSSRRHDGSLALPNRFVSKARLVR